jgi:long-chain acyl-CoA synthetase
MGSQNEMPNQSLPGLLRQLAESYRVRPALRYKREGRYISDAEDYLQALMVARGLRKPGVVPGDRIAILSENRPGGVIADMGILSARAVTVPVYPTNTPEQVDHCRTQERTDRDGRRQEYCPAAAGE